MCVLKIWYAKWWPFCTDLRVLIHKGLVITGRHRASLWIWYVSRVGISHRSGGSCNIEYTAEIHLLVKSCERSSADNTHLRCPMILEFCTKHGSATAELCIKFHKWFGNCENAIDEWNIARYQLSFGGISFIVTTWAPSQYKDRLIYVWRFPC